eukprot:TRINITY_DN4943_c0_g2_i1.p1 TRINITY_DN4943_c0_g2~~TRINITY_DN4943_c0_g2_i1.p1  ORF type:complete len:176 (+),score=25.28 TRINITY_DN4943_c0_g2_i1:279-806(+)
MQHTACIAFAALTLFLFFAFSEAAPLPPPTPTVLANATAYGGNIAPCTNQYFTFTTNGLTAANFIVVSLQQNNRSDSLNLQVTSSSQFSGSCSTGSNAIACNVTNTCPTASQVYSIELSGGSNYIMSYNLTVYVLNTFPISLNLGQNLLRCECSVESKSTERHHRRLLVLHYPYC